MDDLERRCLVFLLRIVVHQCTYHGLGHEYRGRADALLGELVTTQSLPTRVELADVVEAADAFVAGDEAGGGHEVNWPNYMRLKKAVRRYRMPPLPTRVELAGSDPDFTGDLTTEDYMREVRG